MQYTIEEVRHLPFPNNTFEKLALLCLTKGSLRLFNPPSRLRQVMIIRKISVMINGILEQTTTTTSSCQTSVYISAKRSEA